MQSAKCDNCSRDFNIKIRSKLVKDDIRLHYFRCVYCNKKYDTCYTNKEIEERNIKIREIHDKARAISKKLSLNLNLVLGNQAKKLMQVNKEEMDNLKKEMKEYDEQEFKSQSFKSEDA